LGLVFGPRFGLVFGLFVFHLTHAIVTWDTRRRFQAAFYFFSHTFTGLRAALSSS